MFTDVLIILLATLCVTSNYTLKIIYSFNLANTFCDLFSHIYMSLDSHLKICIHKIGSKFKSFLWNFGTCDHSARAWIIAEKEGNTDWGVKIMAPKVSWLIFYIEFPIQLT